MPPIFVSGGRIFDPGVTHGFIGWPAGGLIFGRVEGPGISIWSDLIPGLAVRCLPPEPCYNGCCCPEDTALKAVVIFDPTWVIGSTSGADPCSPCLIGTADSGCSICQIPGVVCTDCGGVSVCAECSVLSGTATPGDIEALPLFGGLVPYAHMEVVGFTVTGAAFTSSLEMDGTGFIIPSFVGPDGVVFPGNSGAGGSNLLSHGNWHIWMGKWTAGDGSVLYVAVLAGTFAGSPAAPGWTTVMAANGITGLINVFTLGPIVPPPVPPKITFGHAANCNAYPPTGFGSGSFNAPGNGLLVGDPTQGTIPS